MATGTQEQIQHVDPSTLIIGTNSRFSLKQSRIDALAANIVEAGGVLQPAEVRETEEGLELTSGFYRQAAVLKLNESGAGLTLPVIVRNTDDKTRLMHQLAENMERENQSPMDMAIAIKQLMDSGVERKEIRRMFARPSGKKGTEVQPASNAWLNIIVNLLELPKAIQAAIHNGVVGVSGAYELGKVSADKRQAVLDRIMAERTKQAEQEEKDEEKYLSAESKALEVEAKLTTAINEETELRAAITGAETAAKKAIEDFRTLQKVDYLNLEDAAKKEHREKLNAAEANVKSAQKLQKDSKNKLAKAIEGKRKLEEAVKEAKEKLDAARKAKGFPKKQDKTVGADEVKKAAAAEGVGTGYVALNASEMRGVISDMAKASSPRVAAIGGVLARVFSGELTTQSGLKEIGALVAPAPGAVKAPAPKKAPAPAAETAAE